MAASSGSGALRTRLARVIGITRNPTILDICKTSLSLSFSLKYHMDNSPHITLFVHTHTHTHTHLSLGEIAIKSSAKGQQSLDDVSFFLF